MPAMVIRTLAVLRVRRVLVVVMLVAAAVPAAAQVAPQRPFGTLREQAAMQQAWLQDSGSTPSCPALMRKHGIDMWVVSMREYNEDPVFSSIVAPETFAARRRTIYVFFDSAPPPAQPAAAPCVRAHRARRHVAGRRLRGAAAAERSRRPATSAAASRPSCGATSSGRCSRR